MMNYYAKFKLVALAVLLFPAFIATTAYGQHQDSEYIMEWCKQLRALKEDCAPIASMKGMRDTTINYHSPVFIDETTYLAPDQNILKKFKQTLEAELWEKKKTVNDNEGNELIRPAGTISFGGEMPIRLRPSESRDSWPMRTEQCKLHQVGSNLLVSEPVSLLGDLRLLFISSLKRDGEPLNLTLGADAEFRFIPMDRKVDSPDKQFFVVDLILDNRYMIEINEMDCTRGMATKGLTGAVEMILLPKMPFEYVKVPLTAGHIGKTNSLAGIPFKLEAYAPGNVLISFEENAFITDWKYLYHNEENGSYFTANCSHEYSTNLVGTFARYFSYPEFIIAQKLWENLKVVPAKYQITREGFSEKIKSGEIKMSLTESQIDELYAPLETEADVNYDGRRAWWIQSCIQDDAIILYTPLVEKDNSWLMRARYDLDTKEFNVELGNSTSIPAIAAATDFLRKALR